MTAGYQLSQAGINQSIGQLAVIQRNLAAAQKRLQETIDSLGPDDTTRAAALVNLGFTSADASDAILKANYMATLAGCYYGTVQQGGTGGTGAIQFNFDNALSGAWGTNMSTL